MQDKLALPIGVTSYKEVCDGYYYADKTLLIKDFLDEQVKIALFTRPRRFGKTLNMDMLRTFFEKTDENTSRYFVNKKIWQQGEKYTQHQGRYPVIFISLKDVKASSWQDALDILKYTIVTEYSRHAELEKSSKVSLADTAFYRRIITNTASNVDYMFSIQALSRMLHSYYGEQAIIIIDEYDTPIQEGYINKYYKQVVEFIRNFFSSALKDNQHMKFGILTGILRIAKESIFSGLNNIRIYSVLDNKFSAYFGFVAEEIQQMASYYNAANKLQELREWYDGYKFGSTEIYNPWSVLYYFSSEHQAMPFWVQTSGNAVIREILQSLNGAVCDNLRALLDGTAIESTIETNIIYPSLKDLQNNIFGFLLMTGYLKSTRTRINKNGVYVCQLEIPNKEIRSIYFNEILSLLNQNIGEIVVGDLEEALCEKNIVALKNFLSRFLKETISYYDGLKENYYHGLLLGMSVVFNEHYYPLSNRESGEGRYDIQLTPKNRNMPGIIIEIKAANKNRHADLKLLAQTALEQIERQKYDTELLRQGVEIVYKYGIAFCGKDVEIVTN